MSLIFGWEIFSSVIVNFLVKLNFLLGIKLFSSWWIIEFILIDVFWILIIGLQVLIEFIWRNLIFGWEWFIHIVSHLFISFIRNHFLFHIEVSRIYLVILFSWVVLTFLVVSPMVSMVVSVLATLCRWESTCHREQNNCLQ